MDRFTKWAQKEHSITIRIIATLIAGAFFVFVIPFFLLMLSRVVDKWLNIPCFHYYLVNYVLGTLIIMIGLFFSVWSVAVQVFKVRGTPLPMIPTKKLLISGPFKYCRNPMIFGILLHYSGIAVWVGSLSMIAIVLVCALLLILYVKRVEEHELECRFGQEYREYKKTTPLIFPKIILRDR
jgi:protein-S-isoprenylcysteine O-methyltransferase Ste14